MAAYTHMQKFVQYCKWMFLVLSLTLYKMYVATSHSWQVPSHLCPWKAFVVKNAVSNTSLKSNIDTINTIMFTIYYKCLLPIGPMLILMAFKVRVLIILFS